jgi:two-component system response regulator YesN
VHLVAAFMDSSFHRELSVDDLARGVNVSASYLSHLFKDEMGISPMQYLKLVRMRKAKELMETTFLNVKQIMNSVGVKDKCHFARDFKKTYGMTPAEYKAQYRGMNLKAESATK